MTRYLIVGNGVAGTTAAENIRKLDPEGAITMFASEDLPYYSRIRLPEYVAGEIPEQDLVIKGAQWYGDNRIDLRLNTRITGGDPEKKAVFTEDGTGLPYDKLLLATGGKSFVPPIPGADLKGVFCLRDVQDARSIREYAQSVSQVAVIGGGVLGLEAGHALVKTGKKVTVVEFMPRLLPRQTDVECAKRLQGILEGMGFSFRLDAKTKAISGNGKAEQVSLESGEIIPAGMVLISAGVRPVLDLASALKLSCDKAVVVNDRMQTSAPDVYAAGDVIEFEGKPYGIWPAASDQGKIAGTNMAGGDASYKGTPMANTLKVAGVDLAAAGDLDPDNALESRVFSDEGVYKKVVFDGHAIAGCVMLGDKTGFVRITKAMAEKTNVSPFKDRLLDRDFDFAQLP